MATLRQIREQQKSVSTINKITKAMKLVSSAKSQKAIKDLREYKIYFKKVIKIIDELSNDIDVFNSEEYKNTYWIVVMSDLGLAGGYNNNILKMLNHNLKSGDQILIIGNKGLSFSKKNKSITECFALKEIVENNSNLLNEITTRIKTKHYDYQMKVNVLYTKFKNQMEFEPKFRTLLPIEKQNTNELISKEKNNEIDAIIEYEPNKETLLKELESLYIHSSLVNSYREAQASEHTARKNAMENATNNGKELLDKLDIEYNRGRQTKITQEISEIIGGSESFK